MDCRHHHEGHMPYFCPFWRQILLETKPNRLFPEGRLLRD